MSNHSAVRLFLSKKSSTFRPSKIVAYGVALAAMVVKFITPSRALEQKCLQSNTGYFADADASALQRSLLPSAFSRTSTYRAKLFGPRSAQDTDSTITSDTEPLDLPDEDTPVSDDSRAHLFRIMYLAKKSDIQKVLGDDFDVRPTTIEQVRCYFARHPLDLNAIFDSISELALGANGECNLHTFKIAVTLGSDEPTLASFHRLNGTGRFRQSWSNKLSGYSLIETEFNNFLSMVPTLRPSPSDFARGSNSSSPFAFAMPTPRPPSSCATGARARQSPLTITSTTPSAVSTPVAMNAFTPVASRGPVVSSRSTMSVGQRLLQDDISDTPSDGRVNLTNELSSSSPTSDHMRPVASALYSPIMPVVSEPLVRNQQIIGQIVRIGPCLPGLMFIFKWASFPHSLQWRLIHCDEVPPPNGYAEFYTLPRGSSMTASAALRASRQNFVDSLSKYAKQFPAIVPLQTLQSSSSSSHGQAMDVALRNELDDIDYGVRKQDFDRFKLQIKQSGKVELVTPAAEKDNCTKSVSFDGQYLTACIHYQDYDNITDDNPEVETSYLCIPATSKRDDPSGASSTSKKQATQLALTGIQSSAGVSKTTVSNVCYNSSRQCFIRVFMTF